nr:MAG TPA: hypothetical protein [Caudoviricetes sp.]
MVIQTAKIENLPILRKYFFIFFTLNYLTP